VRWFRKGIEVEQWSYGQGRDSHPGSSGFSGSTARTADQPRLPLTQESEPEVAEIARCFHIESRTDLEVEAQATTRDWLEAPKAVRSYEALGNCNAIHLSQKRRAFPRLGPFPAPPQGL
jgi:hypothetical protein